MMRFILFFSLFVSTLTYGQLPSNVEKLVGNWSYKTGSGLEQWELIGEELKGKEIRINKLGDSVVVEEMTIRYVNDQLVYVIEEHKASNDTLVHHDEKHFVSKNKKMKFLNIDANVPVLIHYKIGFFNKKKVKIKIQFGENDKPVKLLMFRK